MKAKGYSYFVTSGQIRAYRRLSLRQKLAWLENANRFAYKMLKGRTKLNWEALRKGTI